MTGSLSCIAEIDTTLWINYTLRKKRWKKEKRDWKEAIREGGGKEAGNKERDKAEARRNGFLQGWSDDLCQVNQGQLINPSSSYPSCCLEAAHSGVPLLPSLLLWLPPLCLLALPLTLMLMQNWGVIPPLTVSSLFPERDLGASTFELALWSQSWVQDGHMGTKSCLSPKHTSLPHTNQQQRTKTTHDFPGPCWGKLSAVSEHLANRSEAAWVFLCSMPAVPSLQFPIHHPRILRQQQLLAISPNSPGGHGGGTALLPPGPHYMHISDFKEKSHCNFELWFHHWCLSEWDQNLVQRHTRIACVQPKGNVLEITFATETLLREIFINLCSFPVHFHWLSYTKTEWWHIWKASRRKESNLKGFS